VLRTYATGSSSSGFGDVEPEDPDPIHRAPFPTPSAAAYGSSGNGTGSNTRSRKRPSLETMARKGTWPTPLVTDGDGGARSSHGRPDGLQAKVNESRYGNWPTPHGTGPDGHSSPLGRAAQTYPTPRAGDGDAGPELARVRHGKNLRTVVEQRFPEEAVSQPALATPPSIWPTPRASEWKGTGPLGSKSHEYRVDKHYLDATVQEAEHATGPLSPDWVEWLMGFPIGWTDLEVAAPEWLEGEPWPPDPSPRVPRLAKGVTRRKHRLQQLGNAVVPKVAYVVGLRALDLLETVEDE